MRHALILLCFTTSVRSSCPSGWKELSNGKCVIVPVNDDGSGYGFQPSCTQTCQAAAPAGQTAALTCVTNAGEHQAIVDWMKAEDTINTIVARRSTRYFFWIGNYQPINTECCDAPNAWNACVSGETTSYTKWSPTHVSSGYGAQPDDGANKGPAEDCATITADGWYDTVCYWETDGGQYCLCELGLSPSAAYLNFSSTVIAQSSGGGAGADPVRIAIGLGAAFVIGLLPCCVRALCRKKAASWKERLRSRVSLVTQTTGWLLVVLSLTPAVMLVAGVSMFLRDWAAIVYFVLMLPVGIVCFMLSIVTTDASEAWVPGFLVLFFSAFTVIVGALTAFVGGGPLFFMAIAWALLGVVCAVVSGSALRIPKGEGHTRLGRLWISVRFFFALIGVTLFVLAGLDAGRGAIAVAWAAVGATCLILSLITTPRCRAAFCVWLATLGLRSPEAKSVAQMTFVDLSKRLTDGQPSVEFQCTPQAHTRPTRALDYIVPQTSGEFPTNCAGREELCEVVRKTANAKRQVLVAVCNSGIINQLSKWVESNRRANISNMMIVAIDEQLPKWLEKNGVAYWKRQTSAAGSHKISAQKFQYVREFLSVGCSVLMSDIDVVYLQDPFLFLHNDADVEGTTDGWDDGSAYGWTEHLDDPSMGAAGRYRPAMRITAWNSGLWYIAATHAGMRLMAILAHRMATEDTWDQAAFGEEVTRPARDGHLASGITKRALNHWCFCNSKTLFRRIRTEKRFAEHRPVVVHANYHQPKPPRMSAVYDRWHKGEPNALDRFSGEQEFTVPAPTLEKDFLHQINDGFVSGANTRDASSAIASYGCKPQPSKHQLKLSLHVRPHGACEAGDTLCAAADAVAKLWTGFSVGGDGEPVTTRDVLLVMGGAGQAEEIKLLLASAKKAAVTNILVLLTDKAALAALGDAAPPLYSKESAEEASHSGGPIALVQSVESLLVLAGASAASVPAAGALGFTIARYHVLGALLSQGFGVLYAATPTVLISDPFAHLYRDADVEAMSTGWDDGSAYGYNHVLDDPSMGFTRFCHGSRIVSYEPGFFYSMPTHEAAALMARMATQLTRPAAQLTASSTAAEVSSAEREAFLHELWLPSHHEYASVGAVLRVMNYMCFVNSKVLFRQLRMQPAGSEKSKPIVVQINYHADTLPRMRAAIARYHDGDAEPLKALPLADAAGGSGAGDAPLSCERETSSGDASSKLGAQLIANSPYAWGGVGDMKFEEGGVLTTPWGKGGWAVHAGDATGLSVAADFVGAKHNVRFDLSTGMGVSTRCADSNVVLVRSIKVAKQRAG